jgi:hypothetical protein
MSDIEDASAKPEDLVIAPGGPRSKDRLHPVGPGMSVRRLEDGSYAIVPEVTQNQPERSQIVTEELVITPGGFRPRSMVHKIELGHYLDTSQDRLREFDRASNTLIEDHGPLVHRPAGRPLMPANVTREPGPAPALGTGWITYASWTNNTGKTITFFKTTWVVPPAPATQSGQVIFLFSGIQNSTMIYQPVLQWGSSAAGGGNSWAVASWYADGQGGHSFYSQLVPVNTGDVLVGLMTLTGQSGGLFSYNCQFVGLSGPSLPIQNVQELTWCIETLEAYGLTKCSDYPAVLKTPMSLIEIQTGGAEAALNWQATNAITDCGQHAVVVSDASPGGDVDLYFSNTTSFFNKVTLGDTSPKNPTLASLGGLLYLGWKGDGNDKLNVMCSADGGYTFGNKYTSTETSPQAPSLCAHNGNLYISWKGDGNDSLNVAQVVIAGGKITGFANKVTLGETSPVSPTLASLSGRLYIAWKGDGNDKLNVMDSADNGHTFGNKYTSTETSPQPPALCVHNSNLYIGWKGDGNDKLNVAMVAIAGAIITGFTNKVTLGDTSPFSPALASCNGRLYIDWKGDGNDDLNVMYSSDNGHTFGSKYTSSETSPQPPCLCVQGSSLFIGWKGDGNDKLNVARVL